MSVIADQYLLTNVLIIFSSFFFQVNLTGQFVTIKIIAQRGPDDLGDFALDDIVFLNESCPVPGTI